MTDDNFWSKLGPAAPPVPPTVGDMYLEQMRSVSGSRVFSDEYERARLGQAVQSRADIYGPGYQGLESYTQPAEEVQDARSESAQAYVAEHSPWVRAAARMAEETEAEATAWQAHRAVLDARGAGISGVQSVGTAAFGRGLSERSVAAQGHLAGHHSVAGTRMMSSAEAAHAARQADESARGQVPQRTDVTGMQSTGSGWIGTGR